ncbi:MAG: 4Fe-4S binding protein [Bacteroidetes bacterium]|nr:4Fe-4S binding protein [Bacteroidota bacterium]MBU1423558.1 4Fe-4S binding protein [Bacteroidota bacterium]MBU2471850.1 4Fe-4S binding protein [Bacteroidota bacterium]MBU2635564.1 4Fe-4S binding protein [Bacteroidota bacterium]
MNDTHHRKRYSRCLREIDQRPSRIPKVDWDRCVGCGLCE